MWRSPNEQQLPDYERFVPVAAYQQQLTVTVSVRSQSIGAVFRGRKEARPC